MTDEDLLERAKTGKLSEREVRGVAQALDDRVPGRDPYTLIHILGLAGAKQHEKLVARYLDEHEDPMLVRIALLTLARYWGLRTYYNRTLELATGSAWDAGGEARDIAISVLGDYLRDEADAAGVDLLLQILRDEAEDPLTRTAAYFALARASGLDSRDLPSAARPLDFSSDVRDDVLHWAELHRSRP